MATSSEAVKRLVYRTDVQGADETVRRLGSVAAAQGGVASAMVVAGSRSVDLQQRYDRLTRQQADYARIIAASTAAVAASTAATMQATAANDNYATRSSHLSDVLRVGTKTAIDHAASWLATAGAVGAGALVLGGLLAILGPIIIAYKLVAGAIGLAADAWRLGGDELDRYRKIAEDAAKVDLTTTYFQKLTKGAENAKVPVDGLTAALTSLQKASADQLGGSALQNRLDASVKAGNFAGNSGVQQYAQANTTEQRYEAIVSLINQAMTAGQRLAALDIAGTAFGPQAVENLRKDSEYFDKIAAAAAKVTGQQLVSPEDIGRALDLQKRYDAAVAILETRWHPIQNLLTQAGIEFRANWVSTVETIAQGFDWAAKLIAKLGEVPAWFSKKINEGSQWILDNTTTPESRKAAEQKYGITSDPAEMAKGTDAYAGAVAKLRAGLQDQAEQQRKVGEANTIAQRALGDTSKEVDRTTKATTEQADAYDRALEGVTKHTARMQADAQAVGLGAGALEEYRARTQLMTAAQLAGRDMTAELTAEIEKQAKAAGVAGLELAKVRIKDDIRFDRATIGMTAENAQIAQQLRRIYPDVADAINSAEAAQIRLNNQLREAKEITVGFGNDMLSSFLRGESGLKSMTAAATNLVAKLASANLSRLLQGGSLFGTQSLMSGAGALGIASAGMAGYQSGNMATGALGGAMAGASFGPAGAVIGGVAGLLGGLFGGNSQRRQQEEQERQQREAEAAAAAAAAQQRIQNLNARLQLASIDTTTHLGAMQALEVQFQQERLAEAQSGGQAMAQLIAAQDADRLAAEKAYAAEKAKAEEEALKASLSRMQSYRDRLQAATADTSTLGGALADFEYRAAQQRAAEVEAGGQAINDLIAAQEAERFNIYKKFNDASLDAAKKTAEELQAFMQGVARTITAYLQSLKTGASSILSPQAQLAAAQSNFSAQLALAQGGDRDALSGITQVAQTLLDQAKSFFASSSGYTDIYGQVTAALQGLTGTGPTNTGAVSADALAIVQAVNTTGASNDNLSAAQNALVAAQNALAAQQTTYLQTQVSLLGAINTLADRFVGAINGLGEITVGIGNTHTGQNQQQIAWLISLSRSAGQSSGGTLWSWLGFQNGGVIPGYASGGVVGNGIPGIDSVVARYAGGGTIALAGQEGILTRDATSAIGGAATVDYINRNLRLPQMAPMPTLRAPNDNARTGDGQHFNALGNTLVRAITGAAMAEINANKEEIAGLRAEIARLSRAIEGGKPRAPQPGTRLAS